MNFVDEGLLSKVVAGKVGNEVVLLLPLKKFIPLGDSDG